MTGGQSALALGETAASLLAAEGRGVRALVRPQIPLVVIEATADEMQAHEAFLAVLAKASGGHCAWQSFEASQASGANTKPAVAASAAAP
jgi:DNA polymerase-3 subunit epsilon